MFASASRDPCAFANYEVAGFYDTRGRIALNLAPTSNTKVVITLGQSNMATLCGSVHYTVASSEVKDFNVYDGGVYAGVDPVFGCSSGDTPASPKSSVNLRIADRIISNGKATRVLIMSLAVGGTLAVRWTPNGTADSLFPRISAAIARTRARGLEPDAFAWGQGESDAGLGTPANTYRDYIWSIVDGIRALGCNAPFYVGVYSMNGGVINATTQAGQALAVDTGRNIRAGFDCDTNCPYPTHRLDGTHLNDLGLNFAGVGWGDKLFP